ncbi:hypothetical protein FJY68_12335 [candidate division WOR-3 bacterium]|uniref:DUF3996 domain-containing protein n=1 Tax=candidate division WOR-3 bacterium TaxID=2052148 RepID=A0A937XGC4_UNCW3|nr:hypothetical protein [candidate division WOR-3 bacterium]
MKTLRLVLAVAAFFVATATALPTGAGRLGVGLMAGEPSGLSAKAWLGPSSALDAGLGWGSWWDEGHLYFHADFLYHLKSLVPDSEFGSLPPYFGIGGRVKLADETRIGARIPFGVTMLFEDVPIDLFLEAVPVVNLIPRLSGDWNSSIGFRYYFS